MVQFIVLLKFIADSNRDFLITSHILAIQLRNVKGNLCLKNIITPLWV